jgi:hypothetical protein
MTISTDVKDLISIFEMANLEPAKTGLIFGYIYISTKESSHNCRIKYFKNLREQTQVMIVSIPDLIITEDTLKDSINNKTRKKIVMFAKKNSKKLIDFWNDGQYWPDNQVEQFKKSLKLTKQDIKDNKTIELIWKKS